MLLINIISQKKYILLAMCLLVTLLSTTLGIIFIKQLYGENKNQIYEGAGQTVNGDFAYYNDGAISLLEFYPVLKFNNKKEPIIGKAIPIRADNFYPWGKYLLTLYPYPSFKYGYSLISAMLTWPYDQQIFVSKLPRLAFVNLVMSALLTICIFYSVYFISNSLVASFMSSFLVSCDYSLLYNNYSYMSHTTAGLCLVFLSLVVYCKDYDVNIRRFCLSIFILVFAGLTSSHMFIEIMLIGMLIFLRTISMCHSYKQRLKYTLSGILAACIMPLYIVLVEYFCDFTKLGIPTYLGQFINYNNVVKQLIATYPLNARQIWDLRLFNPYWYYQILFGLVAILIVGYSKIQVINLFQLNSSIIKFISTTITQYRISLIIVPFIFSFLIASYYSQPISRASTVHLVFGEVLLGILLAYIVNLNKLVGILTSFAVLCMACLGSYKIFDVSYGDKFNSIRSPFRKIPDHVLLIDENENVGKIAQHYYKNGGKWVIPDSSYNYINKDISSGVDEMISEIYKRDNKVDGSNYDVWVAFDAFDLVTTYASTRRYWPQFVPLSENVVTTDTYRKDFKFIIALFELIKTGKLKEDNYKKFTKLYWPFQYWDQEYHYILGYNGGVRPYLKNTSMEDIDFHAIYFFDITQVKKILEINN